MKTIFEMKAREYANSTENAGSCPKDVKDAGKYAGYLAGAMYAIKALSEIGIDRTTKYEMIPHRQDDGNFHCIELLSGEPLGTGKVCLIEHAPAAAQVLQLRQELEAKNQNGCCIVEHGYRMDAEHKVQQLEAENAQLKKLEVEYSDVRVKSLSDDLSLQKTHIGNLRDKIQQLEYVNAELKQWRSEDQTALERKDHEILKLQQRVKELEDAVKARADDIAEILDLRKKLKEAVGVIEKFVTKSNGLSFYCREPSTQTELFLKYPTLVEKLQGLYDFQCDVESFLTKLKGGG